MDRIISFAAITLLAVATAQADGDSVELKGAGPCKLTFDENSAYGIDLDKAGNRQVLVRKQRQIALMMIVQYSDEMDKCGVVIDYVFASSKSHQFEFNCVDANNPSAVMLGEVKSGIGAWKQKRALRAWQVDIKTTKLVPTRDRVTCTNKSYSGIDSGDDLLSWARKRSQSRAP